MIDFIYIIQINIFLAVAGFGVYLASKSQSYHHANRALIMGTLILAFFAPLFNLATSTSEVFSGVLSAFHVNSSAADNAVFAQAGITEILSLVYFSGVIMSLLFFGYNFLKVLKLTRTKDLLKSQTITSASVKSASSFLRTIFLQPSLNTADKNLIEQHEIVHTRELHSLDIIIFQIAKALCWFNPVIYLLESRLRETHEFRADEVVAGNTDSTRYSYLLISQAVGVDSSVLMHQFSRKNLLKQRINMLNKKPRQIMKYFVIIPALAAALLIVSCTKENPVNSTAVEHADDLSKSQIENEMMPDVKPIFAKGEQSMVDFLSSEIKYPEGCKTENIEGTVLISFTVDKQGKSGDFKVLKSPDERLSMAALDVMAKMPEWTPAQLDGKPVNMELTLPINYALN